MADKTSSPTGKTEIAIFGGGCFWCTEAVFGRLKGITKSMPGYAGGKSPDPSYERVSMGTTGYIEVVQLEFDPKVISYDQLLEIFWAIHDPTSIDQQGADIGSQYRSEVFFTSEEQKQKAEKSLQEEQKKYRKPIVTKIAAFENFYTAEEYHQNYFDKHPDQPYCNLVISPKVEKVLHKYPELIKDKWKSQT